MCNVQTSSKSKATEKFKHLPKSRNFTVLMPLFGVTLIFCVPVSSSLPLLFYKQCLVTRITSKVLLSAVRCKPSRFIDEDTLVSQQARLQTIWRSTTKTSKILKTTLAQRQKCGETGMSAEAQAQPGQQERTRKKKSNKISVCGPWFVIYELERMLFEIQ